MVREAEIALFFADTHPELLENLFGMPELLSGVFNAKRRMDERDPEIITAALFDKDADFIMENAPEWLNEFEFMDHTDQNDFVGALSLITQSQKSYNDKISKGPSAPNGKHLFEFVPRSDFQKALEVTEGCSTWESIRDVLSQTFTN